MPDCDTTACALSAAAQSGIDDPMLEQPWLDFYAAHQIGPQNNGLPPSVAINDTIDFVGTVVTWIENAAGDRPFGNDVDPTLNLNVLEAAFRNHARWDVGAPERVETLRRNIDFHASELRRVRGFALAYLLPARTLLRLFRPLLLLFPRFWQPRALRSIPAARSSRSGGRRSPMSMTSSSPARSTPSMPRSPYRVYEWNKMKTPTRIVVGGPEVTSAFILSGLAHAGAALRRTGPA